MQQPYVKHDYNSFGGMSAVPYNIIQYLFNNEDIWRLIAYASPDALLKPALTPKQKADLVWLGQDNQENYRVYLTPMQENIQPSQAILVRLYLTNIRPTNRMRAVVTYSLEVLCQTKLGMLDNGVPRMDLLWELIMGEILEKNVNSVGVLFFDAGANSRCSLALNTENNRTYMGYGVALGLHYSEVETPNP
jgi:hypothetical protein